MVLAILSKVEFLVVVGPGGGGWGGVGWGGVVGWFLTEYIVNPSFN